MNRRMLLAVAVPALVGAARVTLAETPRLHVAKSPTCGCCGAWVDHMRAAGFDTRVQEISDEALHALKQRLGLQADLWSCHTAAIDGYVIEGHVPAADVRRLLAQRPAALGLAVPGMPAGSPGMEMDGKVDPFDTLLVGRDGSTTVFVPHR